MSETDQIDLSPSITQKAATLLRLVAEASSGLPTARAQDWTVYCREMYTDAQCMVKLMVMPERDRDYAPLPSPVRDICFYALGSLATYEKNARLTAFAGSTVERPARGDIVLAGAQLFDDLCSIERRKKEAALDKDE